MPNQGLSTRARRYKELGTSLMSEELIGFRKLPKTGLRTQGFQDTSTFWRFEATEYMKCSQTKGRSN